MLTKRPIGVSKLPEIVLIRVRLPASHAWTELDTRLVKKTILLISTKIPSGFAPFTYVVS
jgi:hypothetical protein